MSGEGDRRPRRADPREESDEPVLDLPPPAPVERVAPSRRAPASVSAAPARSIRPEAEVKRETEPRPSIPAAEGGSLAAALAGAQKLHAQLAATLDGERMRYEHRISQLEEERAAIVARHAAELARLREEHEKALEDVRREAPAGAKPEASVERPDPQDEPAPSLGEAARPPKYYGAKVPIVVAPAAAPEGPSKRLLRVAAQLLVVLLLGGGLYANREHLRHAVSPIIDLPKITGTREGLVHIVDALAKEDGQHRLPSPEQLPDFLRANAPPGGADGSKDPWETPYRLEVEAASFSVRSAGPDRDYDTDDDIVAQHARSAPP